MPTPRPPKPDPDAGEADAGANRQGPAGRAAPDRARRRRTPSTSTPWRPASRAPLTPRRRARPSAARGPASAETAPVARVDAGQGYQPERHARGCSQLLNRLWLKNCDAGTIVNVTVRLAVDNDGRVLLGRRRRAGNTRGDPAASASAIRAIAAVHQAAPYAEEFRGRTFSVNFDAAKACANR